MRTDKKNEGGQIMFNLLETIGHAVFNQTIPDDQIIEALAGRMEQ